MVTLCRLTHGACEIVRRDPTIVRTATPEVRNQGNTNVRALVVGTVRLRSLVEITANQVAGHG